MRPTRNLPRLQNNRVAGLRVYRFTGCSTGPVRFLSLRRTGLSGNIAAADTGPARCWCLTKPIRFRRAMAGIPKCMVRCRTHGVGKSIGVGVPCAVYGFTAQVAARMAELNQSRPPGHSGIGTTLSANALAITAMHAMLGQMITRDAYALCLRWPTDWFPDSMR